jgi:hypothetical protein
LGASFDTIIPCLERVLWLHDGDLRIGEPSSEGFIDTSELCNVDLEVLAGVLAIGMSAEGRTLWSYSAVSAQLFKVYFAERVLASVIWKSNDNNVLISSIAACGDRLFAMLQNADSLTDTLCEFRQGKMIPVQFGLASAVKIFNYSVRLNLFGSDDVIFLHDPIDGRLWKWMPGHMPEVLDLQLPEDVVIGVGQSCPLWYALGTASGVLCRVGQSNWRHCFAIPSALPLVGLIEFQGQVWGVDSIGNWTIMFTV